MVKRTLPNGHCYYEAPFTPEEEERFWAALASPPVGMLRGARKAAPSPTRSSNSSPAEKSPRTSTPGIPPKTRTANR